MVALRAPGVSGGRELPPACDILPHRDAAGRPVAVETGREAGVHTTDPADRASAAGELLAAVGATDALLLRAAPTGGWRHVAGHGAGAPSAVQRAERRADRSADHLADRAVRGGGVVRVLSGSPVTVAADYRAATAAVVACEDDVVVVIGSPTRSERLLAASDDELRAAARRLAAVLDVPASGGLTGTGSLEGPVVDELRALHAVQELTGALRRSPAEAVERVARVLQEALGCQLAAVWLDGGPATVVRAVQTGRTGKGGPGSLDGVALDRATDTDVLVAARAAAAASATLGAPLRPEDGAVAALVLPLGGAEAAGGPTGGVLAVRSGPEAQPFSPLRRRIATQLVHTAGTVMAVVLARQKVEQQLSDTRLQLGRDALTDVGSRHRWDSELAAAQGLVNAGVPVAVALLDLDDLKLVNDEHGHAAGDELLRTCGAALRGCLRDSSDVVARVGGDEFAVLVPRVGDVDALVARLRAGVEAARTADGLPLRVSVGAARAEPGRTVAEAVAAADAAMYEDKRRRRAERARTSGRTGR